MLLPSVFVAAVAVSAGGNAALVAAAAPGGPDYAGIAAIIGACTGLVTAVGGLVILARVNKVHTEVKTGNDLKIGALADAEEQRRADAIPAAERTKAEWHAARRFEDHNEKPPAGKATD